MGRLEQWLPSGPAIWTKLTRFWIEFWALNSPRTIRYRHLISNIKIISFSRVHSLNMNRNLILRRRSANFASSCPVRPYQKNHQNLGKKHAPLNFRVGYITKTRLYNFDPLEPNFYIVKLGFTGVYIIFLISAQNINYGYSLEPPRRGSSNEYPQAMFWAEIRKI